MSLPVVPDNLENIAIVQRFLEELVAALAEGSVEIDPVFLSQKGQPNGVPILDSSTLIPTSELGTGTANSTTFLRGDRTWQPAGGGGGGDIKSDGTVPFAADESMGGFKLTNVGTPTLGTDAANKAYVDSHDFRKVSTSGSTTDSFVAQFTHTNTNGQLGVGTVKNTGVTNTMTVQLTATDDFGVTDTAVFDILPSATATYSMSNAVGAALAPFTSYSVAVKSTVLSTPTTFSLRHATTGSY